MASVASILGPRAARWGLFDPSRRPPRLRIAADLGFSEGFARADSRKLKGGAWRARKEGRGPPPGPLCGMLRDEKLKGPVEPRIEAPLGVGGLPVQRAVGVEVLFEGAHARRFLHHHMGIRNVGLVGRPDRIVGRVE